MGRRQYWFRGARGFFRVSGHPGYFVMPRGAVMQKNDILAPSLLTLKLVDHLRTHY